MANGKGRPTPRRGSPARPSPRRSGGAPARSQARNTPARPAIKESALRTMVAARSKGLVVALSRLPQIVIPAVILLLMIIGLATPLAVAVPALVVIVLFIGWLAFLSWPVLAAGQRAVRCAAVGLVALAAVGRIAGWF